jgi:arylsulfatase A-like enzyme
VRVGVAILALAILGCRGGGAGPSRSPAASPSTSVAAAGNPWNVLLITIDTVRADHLGAYGYPRRTSPHIDALAARSALFERAYTFWPKTRGSFVMMMTGRRPSTNGYSKTHPILVDFNPTLAAVLKGAGYETAAIVDNPNVAARHGYSKGFDRYRETWEEKALDSETARARAITAGAVSFLGERRGGGAPFFLWLHYVNPHAPYTPPAPYDTMFLASPPRPDRRLPVVPGFHGGIPKQWAVPGQDRLGYYVAQYDGEIAAADAEVGAVLEALFASPAAGSTVVVLTSDHGESLGEHDYYFDHGEDVFEPSMRIPLIVAMPGAPAGVRSRALASTLDLVPTLLDMLKVSYPPDLAGASLLAEAKGRPSAPVARLFGENERNLTATWDERYRLVSTPAGEGAKLALYDRASDPGETRDVSRASPEALRVARRELELFQGRGDTEWARTRPLLEGKAGELPPSDDARERLCALGYLKCEN